MNKVKIVAVAVAAFVAGIAFVLACGDMSAGPDASIDGFIRLPDANAQISPMQIYRIEDRSSINSGSGQDTGKWSVAECREGDLLLSGGCWLYRDNSTSSGEIYDYKHALVAFGTNPKPPMGQAEGNDRTYFCFYEDRDRNPGMVVVATATCYKRTP